MKTLRILALFSLFLSLSLLVLASYVLWNFNVMIAEQLELIELESMLGTVDPVHAQHVEWVRDNGLLVASFVALGSLLGLIGALYLRKLNRKGMLLQVIGIAFIISAMILIFHVHPLIAVSVVTIHLLLMMVVVINRSKLS
jgi:hypothetical protein